MNIFVEPQRGEWKELCNRAASLDISLENSVAEIVREVKIGGDAALREFARRFDSVELEDIRVSEIEMKEACESVSDGLKDAVSVAYDNIYHFHKLQYPAEVDTFTSTGVRCIQRPIPIERIGLYIPGGTAPLFSTVLMLAIPAKVAGCKKVVLCTPAGKDGKVSAEVLYAAQICGVDCICKVGGAQAVAAMAYGTESVPEVDKIFGPGNRFVTMAKQIVAKDSVAIDMPAGPSEVMVIADTSADPVFVAADLLSQAEHGNDSQVMLVCDTELFAERVLESVENERKRLSRDGYVDNSLNKSHAVVFADIADAVDFANIYAPEHLIVNTVDPWSTVDRITAAGSVFVGAYSPESAGDYASGTNHTLPTSGWARSFSGLNVDAFMRKMTIQEITPDGLMGLSNTIITMAEAEGLQAHAEAVKVRLYERE